MRMKNKAIVVIVAGILLIVYLAQFAPLEMAESFHTGIPETDVNNMQTQHFEVGCDVLGCWKGNTQNGATELIASPNNEPVVTTFTSNPLALSESITLQGTVHYTGSTPLWTWTPNRGYYVVSIKESAGQAWTEIVNGKTGVINTNYVTTISGVPGGGSLMNYDRDWLSTGFDAKINSYIFKIKGKHVGAIKVDQHTIFNSVILGDDDKITSTDYAYLISGEGSIHIEGYSANDVPQFEIGEKIPIHITTHYSGATGAGTGGWELWCYPQDPNHQYYASGFKIPVTASGYINDYSDYVYQWIPPQNMWYRGIDDPFFKLKLYNTLFGVSAVMINTIDLRANAPPTPIATLSNFYPVMGEVVKVTGSVMTNPNTNESISWMKIRAYWADSGEQIGYWTSIPVTSQDPYQFTFPLPAFYKIGIFKVQIWAHDSAGRETTNPAVLTGEVQSQPFERYDLTVYVVDESNVFISGATVKCNLAQNTTNSQGRCMFLALPVNTYEVTATKGELIGSSSVTISGPSEITIVITQGLADWIIILLVVLIFAVFAVMAFVFPGKRKTMIWRIVILLIGVAVAVIVYLYLGGLI